MPGPSFAGEDETELWNGFIENGYVIRDVEDKGAFGRITDLIADSAARHLGTAMEGPKHDFLDSIHKLVSPSTLNGLRLAIIKDIRNTEWFRHAYYSLAANTIQSIVGNELAMQRGIGLSVQLPGDDSSLLPIHADVWDGDSPYEVVLWVPLVDCFATKSMYIVPRDRDLQLQPVVRRITRHGSAEELWEAVKSEAIFLTVPRGSFLLFSQTQMHGNRLNEESTTRWSMNCRFKSLLSPYADKRVGEFFDPVIIRPATRIGMEYVLPEGKEE